MFSVRKNGKELDKGKYTWNESDKIFNTSEDSLVLDFTGYDGVTFNTGGWCSFITGNFCKFYTGHYCTFRAGTSCIFNTGASCAFYTGYDCIFITGRSCVFATGNSCVFETDSFCTFYTGYYSTFNVAGNCSMIRYDVKGITEIPSNKKIRLNGNGVYGYTEIKEEVKEKEKDCNGKVVVIDGKEYTLQLKGE
jgi:hypothetical protein